MANRPRLKLVAFDMDGTLVDVVSSWAFVHAHFGANNDEAVRAFMNNEIDDVEFVRRDLKLWHEAAPSISMADLRDILKDVPIMPGASELMASLRERGILTAIVSGGLSVLADRVKEELGMDYALANTFNTDANGVLVSGRIIVPVKRKEEILRGLQKRLGVTREETASVGNSEIDVGLFRASRIGVAFCPQDATVIAGASVIVKDKDLRGVISVLKPE